MHSKHLGEGARGQLSRAAEALGVQPSFLSRVINRDAHLTPDQAYLLAIFWNLPVDEQNYFQTLVDFERAGNPV